MKEVTWLRIEEKQRSSTVGQKKKAFSSLRSVWRWKICAKRNLHLAFDSGLLPLWLPRIDIISDGIIYFWFTSPSNLSLGKLQSHRFLSCVDLDLSLSFRIFFSWIVQVSILCLKVWYRSFHHLNLLPSSWLYFGLY